MGAEFSKTYHVLRSHLSQVTGQAALAPNIKIFSDIPNLSFKNATCSSLWYACDLKLGCYIFYYLSFLNSWVSTSVGVRHPRHFLGAPFRRSQIAFMSWSVIERMSRFGCDRRRAHRLVISTVPFCWDEKRSQNHVWVPISACRCGQFMNSLPRSKVMDRRATSGRSSMALMIFPMTELATVCHIIRA